ncbi:hypothetical protein GH722_04640 [Alphaproteobacteria bacterium HT1-32]|nr:hypothetical protein [Alphaproteobacteria bacterium HT1-32]
MVAPEGKAQTTGQLVFRTSFLDNLSHADYAGLQAGPGLFPQQSREP